ncbi:histone-fold-containing protein, partial [Lactarius hengduanensis]
LKQVHPDTGISNKTTPVLNSFVNDISNAKGPELLCQRRHFRTHCQKSAILPREIQTAVRLILPGELSKHAISEGTRTPLSTTFSNALPKIRHLAKGNPDCCSSDSPW